MPPDPKTTAREMREIQRPNGIDKGQHEAGRRTAPALRRCQPKLLCRLLVTSDPDRGRHGDFWLDALKTELYPP